MNIIDLVIENNIGEIKKVIAYADVNQVEKETGFTALHYCAQFYNLEIARLLIENKANVNAQDNVGNTPLFKAVFFSEGKTEMIKLLLENGADCEIKNNFGVSAKSLAETISNFNVENCFK